jgi:hypothetical protein
VSVQVPGDDGKRVSPAPVRSRPADAEAPADQFPASAFETGDDDPGIIKIEPAQPREGVGGVGYDFIVSFEPEPAAIEWGFVACFGNRCLA